MPEHIARVDTPDGTVKPARPWNLFMASAV